MRLIALPLLRVAAVVAALVFGAALVAGAVRVLPLALAPSVAAELVPALARGVALVALEVASFIAPPIAAAVVCGRLVARGDARALAAIGVAPARLLADAKIAAAALALASGCASYAWGLDASSPRDVVAGLLARGREACASGGATVPRAIAVPLTGVTWVCFQGEPPRAVLAAEGGAVSATDLVLSSGGTALHARDVVFAAAGEAEVRVHAREADVRGLSGLGVAASNLAPAARAGLLATTTLLLAALVGLAVLSRALVGLRAAAVGVAAPVAALLAFSALEQAPSPLVAYAGVPAAGVAAAVCAAWLASARRRNA